MEHPRMREGMKTAAQQIGAYKLLSENKPTSYDEALLLSMIEEAERRAEQRVREAIARDAERWRTHVMLLRRSRRHTEREIHDTIRAIDAAREAQG